MTDDVHYYVVQVPTLLDDQVYLRSFLLLLIKVALNIS